MSAAKLYAKRGTRTNTGVRARTRTPARSLGVQCRLGLDQSTDMSTRLHELFTCVVLTSLWTIVVSQELTSAPDELRTDQQGLSPRASLPPFYVHSTPVTYVLRNDVVAIVCLVIVSVFIAVIAVILFARSKFCKFLRPLPPVPTSATV